MTKPPGSELNYRLLGNADEWPIAAFLAATRRACVHQWQIERLYQDLAGHTLDPNLRFLYQSLAENAENRAGRYLVRLMRLGVGLPTRRESVLQRTFRWLLVRSGPRWIFRWAERQQKEDRQQLCTLAHLIHRNAPKKKGRKQKE